MVIMSAGPPNKKLRQSVLSFFQPKSCQENHRSVQTKGYSASTRGGKVAAPHPRPGWVMGFVQILGVLLVGVPLCGSTLSSISVDHNPRMLRLLKYLGYFLRGHHKMQLHCVHCPR